LWIKKKGFSLFTESPLGKRRKATGKGRRFKKKGDPPTLFERLHHSKEGGDTEFDFEGEPTEARDSMSGKPRTDQKKRRILSGKVPRVVTREGA